MIAIAACAASSSISSWSAGLEARPALLLGQIEGADHAVRRDDRYAEERAHVGVPGRPPAAKARVCVDVVGSKRIWGLEHRPEHPVGARQRTHLGDQLVAHPGDQEAAEAALAVGDPERRVARVDELAGAVDEPLQDLLDRELRGHREHRVTDRAQRRAQCLGHRRLAPAQLQAQSRSRARASGSDACGLRRALVEPVEEAPGHAVERRVERQAERRARAELQRVDRARRAPRARSSSA